MNDLMMIIGGVILVITLILGQLITIPEQLLGFIVGFSGVIIIVGFIRKRKNEKTGNGLKKK